MRWLQALFSLSVTLGFGVLSSHGPPRPPPTQRPVVSRTWLDLLPLGQPGTQSRQRVSPRILHLVAGVVPSPPPIAHFLPLPAIVQVTEPKQVQPVAVSGTASPSPARSPVEVSQAHVAPAPAPVATAPQPSGWVDQVSASQRAAWERVAVCEESGNWATQGSVYSGGLGISEANWVAFGGQRLFGNEWSASEDQQITIAAGIQGNLPIPDQYGCTGSW